MRNLRIIVNSSKSISIISGLVLCFTVPFLNQLPAVAFSRDPSVLFEGTGSSGDLLRFAWNARFFFHPFSGEDNNVNYAITDYDELSAGLNLLFERVITPTNPDIHGTTGQFTLSAYMLKPDSPFDPIPWEFRAKGSIFPACISNPSNDPCRDVSQKLIAYYQESDTVTRQAPPLLYKGSEVPAPLPLLGLGAAFGYSRKLRKRIKSSNFSEVMSAIN